MPPRRVTISKQVLDTLEADGGKKLPVKELRCPDHNGPTCALCGGTGTVYLYLEGPSHHGGGADF